MGDGKEDLTSPPPLASLLVQVCSERAVRDALLGDLEESFHARAATDARRARSWYWAQAFASLTPLLRRRVNRSALASGALVLVLTALAFAGISAWKIFVARGVAFGFASTFEGAPIYLARLVYVGVHMMSVAGAALAIALLTFESERGLIDNVLRRLTMLGLLIIAPPFVESLISPDGYSLDFLIPWAGAMTIALALGGGIGAKLAR